MNYQIFVLLFTIIGISAPNSGHARSNGISGSTGVSAASTCSVSGCHTTVGTFSPSVEFFKRGTRVQPTSARTGFSYPFTLQVSSQDAMAAGFNLGVSKGTLSSSQVDVRLDFDELTHIEPQFLTNGMARWNLTWAAPDTIGNVNLNVCVNVVNLDSSSLGDNSSCLIIPLSVSLLPEPDMTNPIPVLDPLDDIVFDSRGFLTSLDFPQVTFADNIDGIIGAVANVVGPFQVGSHSIEWTATDASGNISQQSQNLIIKPMLTLQNSRMLNRGSSVPLTVYLSGNVNNARYPINVPLIFSGTATNSDFTVSSNTITINSGNQASVILSANNNGLGTIDVSLDQTASAKYLLGRTDSQSFTLVDKNTAPTVLINITQAAGNTGNVVTVNGGNVSVIASASDPENNNLSYSWESGTDSRILNLISNTNVSQIDFDPNSLAEDIYAIKVIVQDDGTPESATTSLQSWIRVISTLPTLGATDTDADGINDDIENIFDKDSDGVADYVDSSSLEFILPIQPQQDLSQVVYGLPGNKLRLGRLARRMNSNSVRLLTSNVIAEIRDITLIPNDMLGVYDLEILLLPEQTGPVTISLPVLDILKSRSSANVFSQQDGWRRFSTNTSNYFEYADSISGICPVYGGNYANSEQDKQACIAITLEDGGPNDLDGTVDGAIRLRIGSGDRPIPNIVSPVIVTPDSGGGVPYVLLFLLMIVFINGHAHVFMYRKKVKK